MFQGAHGNTASIYTILHGYKNSFSDTEINENI